MANAVNQSLIKELGIDNLPAEEQAEVLMGISRVIYQNITLRVLDELKEEDKDEFDAFLEKNPDDQEAIYEFLKSKIPNLDEIAKEEVEKFQKDSLNIVDAMKE
jgi:hypothetical protein